MSSMYITANAVDQCYIPIALIVDDKNKVIAVRLASFLVALPWYTSIAPVLLSNSILTMNNKLYVTYTDVPLRLLLDSNKIKTFMNIPSVRQYPFALIAHKGKKYLTFNRRVFPPRVTIDGIVLDNYPTMARHAYIKASTSGIQPINLKDTEINVQQSVDTAQVSTLISSYVATSVGKYFAISAKGEIILASDVRDSQGAAAPVPLYPWDGLRHTANGWEPAKMLSLDDVSDADTNLVTLSRMMDKPVDILPFRSSENLSTNMIDLIDNIGLNTDANMFGISPGITRLRLNPESDADMTLYAPCNAYAAFLDVSNAVLGRNRTRLNFGVPFVKELKLDYHNFESNKLVINAFQTELNLYDGVLPELDIFSQEARATLRNIHNCTINIDSLYGNIKFEKCSNLTINFTCRDFIPKNGALSLGAGQDFSVGASSDICLRPIAALWSSSGCSSIQHIVGLRHCCNIAINTVVPLTLNLKNCNTVAIASPVYVYDENNRTAMSFLSCELDPFTRNVVMKDLI